MGSLISEYLGKVYEKIEDLKRCNMNATGEGCDSLLIAYRGEPRDYGVTKLTPSIFRDDSFVKKEEHLFELLEDYGVIERVKNRNIEKMIDAQHYVAISRALDISFNTLVSMYFACASYNSEEDGYEDGFLYIFCFPNYISPHSDEIEKFYCSILNGDDNYIIDKNFKVITHSKNNDRIIAQSGGFIFFPGRSMCNIKDIYYRKVIIKREDKKTILKELDTMFGINKAKLFPEKETVAEMVKKKYQGDSYKKVKDDEVPKQIDEYFRRLDYELEISLRRGVSSVEIQRIIRKEKADIYAYANQLNYEEDKLEELKAILNERFYEVEVSKSC